MDAVNEKPYAGMLVGNVGEPIRLKELNLAENLDQDVAHVR